jgi:hypothetical protein
VRVQRSNMRSRAVRAGMVNYQAVLHCDKISD